MAANGVYCTLNPREDEGGDFLVKEQGQKKKSILTVDFPHLVHREKVMRGTSSAIIAPYEGTRVRDVAGGIMGLRVHVLSDRR